MKITNNSHDPAKSGRTKGLLAAAVLVSATAGSARAATWVDDLAGNHCTDKITCNTCSMATYDLVQELLGTGITVSNVKMTGALRAFGRYSADTPDAFGFTRGVVLSTGFATNVLGPNQSSQTTGSNYQPGDASLSLIAGAETYDAAVLEFDFVPTADVFSFQYVFTSEEYNEYANSAFNDVFGFYVNGTDVHNDVAFIPGTSVPVSINNINGGNPYGFGAHRPELFRNNAVADGAGTIPTEMDGITRVLSAQAHVTPNAVNHIKIAIADVADQYYDSNVIIKANSFSAACIHFDALGKCDAVTPGGLVSFIETAAPANTPPVALCQTVYVDVDLTCNGCGSINAGSYDPDGDAINCVQADQCFGPGTHTTTLTCTDSHGLTSSCTGTLIVADERPPTLTCPANSTAECSLQGPTVAMPVGTDVCSQKVLTTCVGPPNGYFGYGLDSVTCTASDASGTSSCSFTVNVVDTLKPVVTPKADANGVSAYLWPPNHIYWTVSLADCVASATDRCVGSLPLAKAGSFVRAYSDEAEDVGRGGDGHTCNDIVFVDNNTVQLRAERQGGNTHTGRVYHLGYQIGDGHGNFTTGTCVVDVSHDQSVPSAPAIDSCAPKATGPNCDLVAPHAGAYCVPGPGQSNSVCSGYGALHNLSCNY